MAKKSKSNSSLISKYCEKGLAFKKDDGYFGYIGKREVFLGRDDEAAEAELERFDREGIRLELIDSESDQNQEPEILEPAEQESENRLWDDLLGQITKLNPDVQGNDFVVMLQGIDANRWDDRTLPENHPVKTCPLAFYWHRRDTNVENGSNITNNGWTVLNKELAKRLGITTMRDDTPALNFFTVKNHVLCAVKKSDFKMKKQKELIRFKLAEIYGANRRAEAAKEAAEQSKHDVELAAQVFSNEHNLTKATAAETLSVNRGMSLDKARNLIEANDPGSLAEAQKLLNSVEDQMTSTKEIVISESDI